MKSKRRAIRWIVGVGACLLTVPFLLSLVGLLPWSPINCWHYEVDIHSGQIRYTRYLAFIPITQRIEDSALSRALRPEDLRYPLPDWRRALTFSPGVRNSPHYIFHSAIAQIRELEIIWQAGDFTPAARRSSAKRVLELWQEGQSDDAAKPYLRAISDIAFRSDSEQKSTDERDLPTVH
jgi:hypothetical protein